MGWSFSFRERKQKETRRVVQLTRVKQSFCSNKVITSKYTRYTFVPKNLWQQFQKLSNVYFLLICVLQATPVGTTNGVPVTAFPLILVLVANAAKDAYEDVQRHKSDTQENGQITFVLKRPIEKLRLDSKFAGKGPSRSLELSWLPDINPSPRYGDMEVACEGSLYTDNLSSRKWEDLKVGDVVYLTDKELFPADIVLLATSDEQGVAFVETSSLDGETNLKIRKVAPGAMKIMTAPSLDTPFDLFDAARNARGFVECDPPNASINTFDGVLCLSSGLFDISSVEKDALTVLHVGLRGCRLRNTAWALGLVIYTGEETKIQKNSGEPPHKMSRVERLTNIFTFVVLLLQLVVCLVGAIGTGVFNTIPRFRALTYLNLDAERSAGVAGVLTFFTWLTLFSNFIPISLIVSLGVVKAIQTMFISRDMTMYHEETKTGAAPRTSDLNEELGQVQYVFSDKTGTLTSNKMEFRKCCIGAVSYGTGITQIRRRVIETELGIEVPPDPAPGPRDPITPNVNFVDNELWKVLKHPATPEGSEARDFFFHLAVNHLVVTERLERRATFIDGLPRMRTSEFGGSLSISSSAQAHRPSCLRAIQYSASSPDEGALVYAARHFGISFLSRSTTGLIVDVRGSIVSVDLLASFEFTSRRKRSSVICSYLLPGTEERVFALFTKGADTVIVPRLNSVGPRETEILSVMDEYAVDGLRTLCLARRLLAAAEVDEWMVKYSEAAVSMDDREAKLEEVAEEIETNLELQGVTGIEDKLQDGVHKTIELLMAAGMQIWMLTGDKLETAVNIGVATSLITPVMPRMLFQWETIAEDVDGEEAKSIVIPDDVEQLASEKNKDDGNRIIALYRRLELESNAVREEDKEGIKNPRALVVDGDSLTMLLQEQFIKTFTALCASCSTVVCSRVSPQQKGAIVSMIRTTQDAVTLAIGDGANDCAMLQCAHVGVGIRGVEGLQAFNTSDYGISQFRHLAPLLLLHGRYSYRRNSKFVTYMFYKNIVLAMPIFYFTTMSSFSGQKIYSELIYQLYNVLLTSLPIIVFGLLDQDVSKEESFRYPQLYKLGINNAYFNTRIFAEAIFAAAWHSVPIYLLPLATFAFTQLTSSDGVPNDLWAVGQLMFLQVMVVVNIKVLIESYHINWILWLSVIVSVVGWFVFMFVVSVTPFLAPETTGVLPRILSMRIFYPFLFIVPIIALSRDVIWKVVRGTFRPRLYHKIFAGMNTNTETATSVLLPSPASASPPSEPSPDDTVPSRSSQVDHVTYKKSAKTFHYPSREGAFEISLKKARMASMDPKLGRRMLRYGTASPGYSSSTRGYAFTAPDRGAFELAAGCTNINDLTTFSVTPLGENEGGMVAAARSPFSVRGRRLSMV